MDFETVVKRRRMCREYLGREVPQEKVDCILDLASRYPLLGTRSLRSSSWCATSE
jgi:nitroreductase